MAKEVKKADKKESHSKEIKKHASSSKIAASKRNTPRATLGAVNRLENLKSIALKSDIPNFKSGDKVVVRSKIREGDKERIQAFEGVVIARDGRGVNETFTVRKVSAGVGVERVYPLHSPRIESIEVKVEGFVRRAKLYYLRDRDGRAARIQDRSLKLMSAMGGGAEAETEAAKS